MTRADKAGRRNANLKAALGELAATAAHTDTFLGERFRLNVKRRGRLMALVAIARPIQIIIWHLPADRRSPPRPRTRPDYHRRSIRSERKRRNPIAEPAAMTSGSSS
ncbi:hypothetical protein [Mycolicibacterium sp. CR10]|uniref:hypothetical protein n=1 Tax=Mycolicibacterium sp. CR10 TaxID=2562314 RepID=UPI0010C11403|nr:hypothetical protein [Mycolicibacterium sp. CR10]